MQRPFLPSTAPAPITALRTEGHLSAGGAGRPSSLRLLRAGRPGASPFSYVGRGRTGTAELRYVDSLGGGTAGLLQAQKHMLSIRDSIQMPGCHRRGHEYDTDRGEHCETAA